MENNFCPTTQITRATFSIYPISHTFLQIILSPLKQVHTTKLSINTHHITTSPRPPSQHLFHVLKAI
ncbi:Ykof family thiamine-binding protein, partial [Cytobacillus oceanisediminis]|uniref:Ykof family thiamine-binding protein n=1 Tax=Cytobacillus oceanisediminis TaxID=665099 RepID=UPI001C92D7C1